MAARGAHYYQDKTGEPPERLPSLASLEPVEEIEKDLLKEMQRIDRIAAAPGGTESIVAAIADEFHTSAQEVRALTQTYSLRLAEVVMTLALAEESRQSLQSLIQEVEQTRSWPEVARDHGIPVAILMRRLRAAERTARKLVEGSR